MSLRKKGFGIGARVKLIKPIKGFGETLQECISSLQVYKTSYQRFSIENSY